MKEDNTFKKLKGLTREEALVMYNDLCNLAIKSPDIFTVKDMHNFANEKMRGYGWTVDMLDDPE